MIVSKKLGSNSGVTIPKTVRLKLDWKPGMSLDMETQEDGTLLIRAHAPTCRFCGAYQKIRKYKDLHICAECAEELKGALS